MSLLFWFVVAFYSAAGGWTFKYLWTVREPIQKGPPVPEFLGGPLNSIESSTNYVGHV